MQNQETSITIRAVDKASYAVLSVAANLETLSKKMAKTSQLGYAMGQLGQQLGPLQNRLSDIGSKWGAAGRRIAGVGLVVGGAAFGLTKLATGAAEATDKLGDLASRYQLNTKSLQVFGALLEDNGFSLEDTAAGMGKLKKSMHEALTVGGSATNAFAGVGISLSALKGMRPEEVLLKISDAFEGSEKDYAKQAVLLELMGKNGTIFMDTMNKGSGEYRARLKEMIRDGSLFDDDQIAFAGRFADKWGRMSRTMQGLQRSIGLRLAERLEPLLDKFQDWLDTGGAAQISEKFDRIFTTANIEKFATGMIALKDVVLNIGSAFKWMIDTVGPTATIWAGLGIVLAPIGGALFSTGKGVWDLGRGLIFLGGKIPGVATGLATIGSTARVTGLALQALGAIAMRGLGPLSIALTAILASYKAIQAYQRLSDTQEANAKDNGVRQDKRAAYNGILRSVGGEKFVNSFGANTDFQQLNTVVSGLERGGQVAPGTAARLAALPVDVSGLMKIEISATGGATARVTEIKKEGRMDFEASTGPLMQGF